MTSTPLKGGNLVIRKRVTVDDKKKPSNHRKPGKPDSKNSQGGGKHEPKPQPKPQGR